MKSVGIITPTTKKASLKHNLDSVKVQTYAEILQYYVVDGQYCEEHPEYVEGCWLQPATYQKPVVLPENTGGFPPGFYGHRIYAAFPLLMNTDYICFLDEDTWMEPEHVQTCVETIERNDLEWCFSLRNIHDKDGKFICRDDCESLGSWKTADSYFLRQERFHIDTNCFCIKRDILIHLAHTWYGGWGQDRRFFNVLKEYFPKFKTTGKYTINYALGGNEGSVKADYFHQGNEIMKQHYPHGFPWNLNNNNTQQETTD